VCSRKYGCPEDAFSQKVCYVLYHALKKNRQQREIIFPILPEPISFALLQLWEEYYRYFLGLIADPRGEAKKW